MHDYVAFCPAEEINHTQHNLLTPRGAKVRDGLSWSKYIDQAIQAWGEDIDLIFGCHHWPMWNVGLDWIKSTIRIGLLSI